MRRWTVLLVSHDSEAPRTYSVSERAIRVGVLLGIAVTLVAMIGLGTVIANLGSLNPRPAARVAALSDLVTRKCRPTSAASDSAWDGSRAFWIRFVSTSLNCASPRECRRPTVPSW